MCIYIHIFVCVTIIVEEETMNLGGRRDIGGTGHGGRLGKIQMQCSCMKLSKNYEKHVRRER